jgi:hypothetical protein
MSFQGTTRTDPYERVYAYGSYHGSMAAKLLAAHRPFPGTCSFPALCREHVGLNDVPHGPCPSLPNLRRRFPSLVRLAGKRWAGCTPEATSRTRRARPSQWA